VLLRLFTLVLALTLCACVSERTAPSRSSGIFNPYSIAKTDIDRVTEAHQQEIFHSLKLLAEKLYRRNPRELKKSGRADVAAGVTRIFQGRHDWRFPELGGARGVQAIHLAFSPDYQGDRVLAYVAGLGSMIQRAFNDKTDFYVHDDLDAQNLHNAARNVEIAVWKLAQSRTAQGELYLLSNETAGPVINLSYEREFGKMIGSLDVLSKIIADKNNRTVVKVVQSLATAVFLPIR
jgi:hypothetical protein